MKLRLLVILSFAIVCSNCMFAGNLIIKSGKPETAQTANGSKSTEKDKGVAESFSLVIKLCGEIKCLDDSIHSYQSQYNILKSKIDSNIDGWSQICRKFLKSYSINNDELQLLIDNTYDGIDSSELLDMLLQARDENEIAVSAASNNSKRRNDKPQNKIQKLMRNSYSNEPRNTNVADVKDKTARSLMNIKNELSDCEKDYLARLDSLRSVWTMIDGRENYKTNNLRKFLNRYGSLDELFSKYNRKEMKGNLIAVNSNEMAETYLTILDMYEHLENLYNKENNQSLINRIQNINEDCILPQHIEQYKELQGVVRDYRYITSELLRIFNYIDFLAGSNNKISGAEIKKKLEDDGELVDINRAEYTKNKLDEYVTSLNADKTGRGRDKNEIKNEISKAL